MNVKEAIKQIRAIGCTVNRTAEREFRVNIKGGNEDSAYYTSDAEDAVSTARKMASMTSSVALTSEQRLAIQEQLLALPLTEEQNRLFDLVDAQSLISAADLAALKTFGIQVTP